MESEHPCRLIPDILDCIIDFLHDDQQALRLSCLVSKLWIFPTRRHLFKEIKFSYPAHLDAWKKIFPNPAESPAHHTRSLLFGYAGAITADDTKEGGVIRSFSNVVRLELGFEPLPRARPNTVFAPFYDLWPDLKSLRLTFAYAQRAHIFPFFHSLPFLEDLYISGRFIDDIDEGGGAIQSSTSPVFTGTLTLNSELEDPVCWFSSLPGGLHFQKIVLVINKQEELERVATLVDMCSGTLECISINLDFIYPPKTLLDLSQATKLKEIMLWVKPEFHARWAGVTLGTITSKHKDLRQVQISLLLRRFTYPPPNLPDNTEQGIRGVTDEQSANLDKALVRLFELHKIRTEASYTGIYRGAAKEIRELTKGLLPKATQRGLIETVVL